VVGLHARDDTVGAGARTVTVPPEPLTVREVPSPVEPFALVTPMEAVEGVVRVSEATTPSGIGVVFIPYTMQTAEVDPTLQPMILPAAVSEAPPVTCTPETVDG
jgi:hypothetical protein